MKFKYMIEEKDLPILIDLVNHYEQKGYLLAKQAKIMKRYIEDFINPFELDRFLGYLAEGLHRNQHYPHVIDHKLINKKMLEKLWEAN